MKAPCTCGDLESGCLAVLLKWTINQDLPKRVKAGMQPIRIPKVMRDRHKKVDNRL